MSVTSALAALARPSPTSLQLLEDYVTCALNNFFKSFIEKPQQISEIWSRWIEILPLPPEAPRNPTVEKVIRAIKTILNHDLRTLLNPDMDKRDIALRLMFSKSTCQLLCMRSEYSESLANALVAFDKAGLETNGKNWCWLLANSECAASLAELMTFLNLKEIITEKKIEILDFFTAIFLKWKQIEVLSKRETTASLLRKIEPLTAAVEDEAFAKLRAEDFSGFIKIDPAIQKNLISGWWIAVKLGLLPDHHNNAVFRSQPQAIIDIFKAFKILNDLGLEEEVIDKTIKDLMRILPKIINLDCKLREYLINNILIWFANNPQSGSCCIEILLMVSGSVDVTPEIFDLIQAIKKPQKLLSILAELKIKHKLTERSFLDSLNSLQLLKKVRPPAKRPIAQSEEKRSKMRVQE